MTIWEKIFYNIYDKGPVTSEYDEHSFPKTE